MGEVYQMIAPEGERTGRIKGQERGRKIAYKEGHNPNERSLNSVRYMDEYQRKHKKDDHYETDYVNQLNAKKKSDEEKARQKRLEELERRRVEAEEKKARAQEEQARNSTYNRYDKWYKYYNDKK